MVFKFGQGQELSEHTAAKPAMLFFVKGEASVGLGDDTQEAQAGTWVHMPAGLQHSIQAKTPVVIVLVLVSLFLRTHADAVDDVVAWASTNVHNLMRHPITATVAFRCCN